MAFSAAGVKIKVRPIGKEVEVYALSLCMEALVYWAHEYSFGESDFEYWVTEPRLGQHRKGIGAILYGDR